MLDKRNLLFWTAVASATTTGPNEDVTYTGTAGTYRWRILARTGSGAYTFRLTRPN